MEEQAANDANGYLPRQSELSAVRRLRIVACQYVNEQRPVRYELGPLWK